MISGLVVSGIVVAVGLGIGIHAVTKKTAPVSDSGFLDAGVYAPIDAGYDAGVKAAVHHK